MNQLAKKCVIASGVLHGTLGLTLIFVSGFASSDPQPDVPADVTITSVPVEDLLPKSVPVVATPVAQAPQLKEKAPQPVRVLLPLNIISRPHPTPVSSDEPDDTSSTEAQNAFAAALKNIQERASGRVEMNQPNERTGGPAGQQPLEEVLKRVYFNSWRQPADAVSEDAVVKVSVTVARDGSVISARITKSSGDAAVDRSVAQLLREVTFIAPFPSGSKEAQRTFPLSFSLKAKRSLG